MAQAPAQTGVSPVKQADEQRSRRPFNWINVVIYVMLAIFTISSVGPFIFAFFSSFKTFDQVLDFPPTLFPKLWTWTNYGTILSDPIFIRWLGNSFIYAIGAALLNVLFSAMAGYALSRMQFRGRNFIFILTLAVMMIPSPITIIPKFLVMNGLGLTNTYFALLLPAMAQPFSVFLMVQFMKGLPKELEESARNRWGKPLAHLLPDHYAPGKTSYDRCGNSQLPGCMERLPLASAGHG